MRKHEVLVVEDEPQWQRELRNILEAGGYKVAVAGSYTEAIEALRRRTAEVVVIDVSLIIGNSYNRQGLKVAKEATVPVVCISGYFTKEEVEEINEEGVSPWFFRKQEFINMRKRFLEVVACAMKQSAEEIRGKWNFLELKMRKGD